MPNTKPTVLLLSRNYSNGLAVARMLGSVGFTIDMIASSHIQGASDVAACSKYIRNFSEVVSKKVGEDGEQELLDEILAHKEGNNKTILIPTDDYTTTIMDINRDKLEPYFVMPSVENGGQGDLSNLMDKTTQAAMAKSIGLNVADSWTFYLEDEIVIPDDMVYPCYVKPVKSIVGYKTEMAVCNSADELRGKLEKLKERYSDRTILVQEFLNIDYEIASAGLCLNQHVVLPGLIRKTRVGKHGTGVTLTGELVSNDILGKDIAEKAVELLKLFHYTGMFGMEFAVCGDKIYFNEVNLRSAGESFAYYLDGVNLAELYVKGLLGESFDKNEEELNEFGKTIVYDKIAYEDLIYGFLSRGELDECLEKSDYAILVNDDDPAPGNLFVKKSLERWEEKEFKRRRRKQKEECLKATMEATGWDEEYALQQIKYTRKKLGITYNAYRQHELYLVPVEEQAAKYDESRGITRSVKQPIKKTEGPLVVVLSRNYQTGLSVIRSIGAAGYQIDLVASAFRAGESEIATTSKYVRNWVEIVSRKGKGKGEEYILEELQKYSALKEKAVLFPTDDYTASVMDNFRDELKDIFIMPEIIGGGAGAMTEHMDKSVQSQLAREVGLPTPKEWIVELSDGTIPEDIVYPCFCKPTESISGFKAEMARCNNEEELDSHLTMLRGKDKNRKILIQEFLEIDDEIDMSGICFDDEVVIPAIIRKTQVAQFEKGVTLAGKLVPLAELGGLEDKIIEMMKNYHYFGMFDLELNIVGDRILFNEVNLRSGGPNYSYFANGVNIPGVFVNEAFGKKHTAEELEIKQYGRSFVYEKVAWEDYINGFITKKQLDDIIKNADCTLLCTEDDPVPGQLFIKSVRSKSLKSKKNYARYQVLGPMLRPLKQKVLGYPQTKRGNERRADEPLPRVLVSGRNYCSNLCMARSLGMAGYDVEILRIFQTKPKKHQALRKPMPEAYTKYVKGYYYCISHRKARKIVDKFIEIADPHHKMLIVPVDDLVADIIDEYYDELSPYYIMPNVDGKGGQISKLMSKGVQKELAKEFGLPVLDSCLISVEKGKFVIPENVPYPCIIKPNISKNSSKSSIRICQNETELRDNLISLSARKDIEMICEQFVNIDKEYSLLGLSTVDGVVGPGFFVAEEGGQKEHRGVALMGKILDTAEYQELIDQLNAFMATLKFNGLFDIDLIKTTEGKMYFVEINMRYGASGYALTKCGANLPGMFADYMIQGKPVDLNAKVAEVNKTFVSERVLIDEYAGGRIEMDKVTSSMKEADIHFIMEADDPKPYKHFKKFYRSAKKIREFRAAEEQRLEREAAEVRARIAQKKIAEDTGDDD